MAAQEFMFRFDPKDLDRLRKAITDGIQGGQMVISDPVEITPLVEPITITVPIERRKDKATPQATEELCLFFDTSNQEHWVTQERGDQYLQWRQAFFLPRP